MEACPGCGIELPKVEGPCDPYGGASPACWAVFGEVCARDFGEYRYPDEHRLVVDAYMAQHPNFDTAAGRRSVATHLVGLHCVFERELPMKSIGRVLAALFPDKRDIRPFEPIPSLRTTNIFSVRSCQSRSEYAVRAREWGFAVWKAWSPHHRRVEELLVACGVL
jgi:hypothetical protein